MAKNGGDCGDVPCVLLGESLGSERLVIRFVDLVRARRDFEREVEHRSLAAA